jgi:hypothetical protein
MFIVYAFNHINYSFPNGEEIGDMIGTVSLWHAIVNCVVNISNFFCLFRSFPSTNNINLNGGIFHCRIQEASVAVSPGSKPLPGDLLSQFYAFRRYFKLRSFLRCLPSNTWTVIQIRPHLLPSCTRRY